MKASFLLILISIVFFSCSKENNPDNTIASLPTISTLPINSITATTASGGGNVVSDGGAAVTARGICWSISHDPVIGGDHSSDGSGTGPFSSAVTGLDSATAYYVRAYATNSVGTAYGNEVTLTTATPPINDVYVAGWERENLNSIAKVWINGVRTSLSDPANNANAVELFLSGTDLYVLGSESSGTVVELKVWKNGVASLLESPSDYNYPRSIFVSGTDVYVVGDSSHWGNCYGRYWKNGILIPITDNSGCCAYSSMSSVFVSNGDVYIAGSERIVDANGPRVVAQLWKNGVGIPQNATSDAAFANAVFVSCNDVYVTGWETFNNND